MSSNMTPKTKQTWVEPTQKRSKDKVARILETARSMIVQSGSANLKMTEVAKSAGVAIGTLYQFFPSSTALVEKLFEVEMEPVDGRLEEALAQADTLDALLETVEHLLEDQIALVQNRPALLVIWGAAGLHPDIQAADFQNTQMNAERLSLKLVQVMNAQDNKEEIETLSMLICHLWSGVVRLALLDTERGPKPYVAHYNGMLRAYALQVAGRT